MTCPFRPIVAEPRFLVLKIVHYPHPILRRASKPLRRVDAELRKMVAEMFELIYDPAHKGIGLAANQVDLPYRLFVANISGDSAAKDQEFVFINPVISHPKGSAEAEEGCLSLPGLYAQVRRPERIVVTAYNLSGEEARYDCDGLFARCVQHECDHLDGVLFVDKLPPTAKISVKEQLDEFEAEFASRRQHGEIGGDDALLARWEELERLRS